MRLGQKNKTTHFETDRWWAQKLILLITDPSLLDFSCDESRPWARRKEYSLFKVAYTAKSGLIGILVNDKHDYFVDI